MKKRKELLFVVVSFILLLILARTQFEWKELYGLLKKLDLRYMFIAFGFMLAYQGLEAHMIYRLILQTKREGAVIKGRIGWIALKATLIGQYYSHITPFSSGGQPMQLFHFTKHDISPSHGTGVLVSKFLFYQVTITVYALTLTATHFSFLSGSQPAIIMTLLLGLTINTVGLLLIIMVAFRPALLARFLHRVIEKLSRFSWLKKADEKHANVDRFVSEYTDSLNRLKSMPLETLKLFVLSLIQISLFFGITVMIYYALGLNGVGLIKIITLQSIVYMCVSFVPIPGTLGASELSFSTVLSSVFTHNLIGFAMLLWRLVSYYFSLIVCGVFTVGVALREARQEKKRPLSVG